MNITRVLLFLHFLGLAMGFSTSFANMMMSGLISKAAPAERPILGRFPPLMSRIGTIGITLLWASGLGMLLSKWGGFGNLGSLPWQFHAKLTLVIVLTLLIGYIHSLERRMRTGDTSAVARIQAVGRVAFVVALSIVALAIAAFD
jgi:hypothetical protein